MTTAFVLIWIYHSYSMSFSGSAHFQTLKACESALEDINKIKYMRFDILKCYPEK